MKIALDPYMFRRVPLTDLPGLADSIATVCVFAWEDRVRESCLHNLQLAREYPARYSGGTA